MPRFTLDGLELQRSWACVGFDDPWNGWATPIVGREALEDFVGDADWALEDHWAGVRISPPDGGSEPVVLRADADGQFHLRNLGWTLVEMADGGEFCLDAMPETVWHAERFGEPWNGWTTPVVTHGVLLEMLADVGWAAVDALGTITATDPEDESLTETFEPDARGFYDLGALGWTFQEVR